MLNRQTSVAYIDLLTIMYVLFVVSTAILMALNVSLSKGNITDKAEYIAILSWDDTSTSDLDLWAKDPVGDLAFYKNRDVGLLSLDHDDRGVQHETIIDKFGKVSTSKYRQEILSVRGVTEGTYIFSVMLYSINVANPDKLPIHAKVQIIKLNPYSVVTEKDLTFNNVGEEHTVVTFHVNADGSYDHVDKFTENHIGSRYPS